MITADSITAKDLVTASDANLVVCSKCGWYTDRFGHDQRCYQLAGKRANDLIARFPATPSGKLGYGNGLVHFEPDDKFNIRFQVSDAKADSARPFTIADIWLLDDLSPDEATELTGLLIGWRAHILNARAAKASK